MRQGGDMRDLGTLGFGNNAAAWAINEQGQVIGFSQRDQTTPGGRGEIAGNGLDAGGVAHGFVLIPCDGDHPNIAGCDY